MDQLRVDQTEPKPTYYVIRMDAEGKSPTKAHNTRNHAHRAAEALARKNPGVEFAVVKKKTAIKLMPNLPISVS